MTDLQAIDVEDIIKAIGYTSKAPISKAPEDLEPCTCETEGRCAPCDRLPLVLGQRLAVSDLQRQTSRTVNSSASSWSSINGELQRECQ